MTLQDLVRDLTPEQVGSQTFRYVPKNWTAYPQLSELLSAAGFSQNQIDTGFTLSRSEVRAAMRRSGGMVGLALVPVWGYPRGVAGSGNRKPLRALFDNAEMIIRILLECAGQRLPTRRIQEAFVIPHLGLSTLSKILYFAGLESKEGPLLIYDQMVMRALHHHAFAEYGPWPDYGPVLQDATYGRFVDCTKQAACALQCAPDVIEYALFREGQRLGPSSSKGMRSGRSGLEDNLRLYGPGFNVAPTWGKRSLFSYQVLDSGGIILRFGRQGECKISSEQLTALRAEFGGREAVLATGDGNLQAWLDIHVTTVRITSYLAPVLIFLGDAMRQGGYLKFAKQTDK